MEGRIAGVGKRAIQEKERIKSPIWEKPQKRKVFCRNATKKKHLFAKKHHGRESRQAG